MNRSTLIFSPEQINLGPLDTALRYTIGGATLFAVVALLVPTPHYIFAFSLVGVYAVITAIMHLDPVYSLLHISHVPINARTADEYWRYIARPRNAPEHSVQRDVGGVGGSGAMSQ